MRIEVGRRQAHPDAPQGPRIALDVVELEPCHGHAVVKDRRFRHPGGKEATQGTEWHIIGGVRRKLALEAFSVPVRRGGNEEIDLAGIIVTKPNSEILCLAERRITGRKVEQPLPGPLVDELRTQVTRDPL
jgi:hypothetical protein